jgi:hypothetical protein
MFHVRFYTTASLFKVSHKILEYSRTAEVHSHVNHKDHNSFVNLKTSEARHSGSRP